MNSAPETLYKSGQADPNVLAALRDLFSKHPETAHCGAEALAEHLYIGHFLPRRPRAWEVEAALEVLDVETGAA